MAQVKQRGRGREGGVEERQERKETSFLPLPLPSTFIFWLSFYLSPGQNWKSPTSVFLKTKQKSLLRRLIRTNLQLFLPWQPIELVLVFLRITADRAFLYQRLFSCATRSFCRPQADTSSAEGRRRRNRRPRMKGLWYPGYLSLRPTLILGFCLVSPLTELTRLGCWASQRVWRKVDPARRPRRLGWPV